LFHSINYDYDSIKKARPHYYKKYFLRQLICTLDNNRLRKIDILKRFFRELSQNVIFFKNNNILKIIRRFYQKIILECKRSKMIF